MEPIFYARIWRRSLGARSPTEIRALVRFEDLPANVRALMLTKLAMELNIHRCANLQDLARKQRTDTTGAWRVICRLLRQPVSTIRKTSCGRAARSGPMSVPIDINPILTKFLNRLYSSMASPKSSRTGVGIRRDVETETDSPRKQTMAEPIGNPGFAPPRADKTRSRRRIAALELDRNRYTDCFACRRDDRGLDGQQVVDARRFGRASRWSRCLVAELPRRAIDQTEHATRRAPIGRIGTNRCVAVRHPGDGATNPRPDPMSEQSLSPDAKDCRRKTAGRYSRLLVFFALVYVVEGFGQVVGLIAQPLSFYLKEVHGWTALQVTAYLTIFNFPWIIKPIYGAFSDFVPLFGYRRKPYLLAANVAAAGGFFWATQLTAPDRLFWALQLTAYAMAISSTVCGAVLVENGQRLGESGRFVNQQWLWFNVAAMVASILGGELVQRLSPSCGAAYRRGHRRRRAVGGPVRHDLSDP